MPSRRMFSATASVAMAFLCLAIPAAHATSIPIEMTTTAGTVPGTAITYTVTATGIPVVFFAGAGASDNGTWTWQNGFPQFLTFGSPQTLTVNFSAPVDINRVIFGVASTSASTSQLTLTGGTASTSDFDLTDNLFNTTGRGTIAAFDATTGSITATGQDQSVMIGSTSRKTIDSFTLSAGASDGGGDGFTEFVGFTDTAPLAPVPEPSSLFFLGTGVLAAVGVIRRKSFQR